MSIRTTIPDYPSYQVNVYGEIRSKRTGLVLRQFPDRYGYMRVSLGSVDNVYVHRLVCRTFYGDPVGSQDQVNHIDGNRQNNHALNLEWCSPSENIRWGVIKGTIRPDIASIKAREVNMRPVRIVELDREFSSVKECAEFLGVEPTNVSRCLVGARKGQRLHGYRIEFVRERSAC